MWYSGMGDGGVEGRVTLSQGDNESKVGQAIPQSNMQRG